MNILEIGTDCLESDGMSWLVKESFVRYILRVGGRIDCEGEARVLKDVGIFFPLQDGQSENVERHSIAFSGSVHFSAHAGFLDLRITDPVVELGGDSGLLHASIRSDGIAYPSTPFAALGPAPIPVPGDDFFWFPTIPAEATSFGSTMLGDVYTEGTPLAPISMRIPRPPLSPQSNAPPSDPLVLGNHVERRSRRLE